MRRSRSPPLTLTSPFPRSRTAGLRSREVENHRLWLEHEDRGGRRAASRTIRRRRDDDVVGVLDRVVSLLAQRRDAEGDAEVRGIIYIFGV